MVTLEVPYFTWLRWYIMYCTVLYVVESMRMSNLGGIYKLNGSLLLGKLDEKG